jgi:hypothetical protein
VLFFELIAPFMAMLSVVVAIWLYRVELRARQHPEEHRAPARPPKPANPEPEKGGRRPSMSP